MSEEIRYYMGKYKVKVVTQSAGYWIVEALESFEDTLNGEKVIVQVGEKRIIPPRSAHRHKLLGSAVKEHAYELEMEKKLKHIIAGEEKKSTPT